MSNDYLLFGVIGVVVVLTIIFAAKDSLNPYVPAGPLFTKAELLFYRYLVKAVGDRALVFGKVRIADVIQPKKSLKGNRRTVALNKIAQKHFDFVIVHPETMKILAAVELNDSSHKQKDRAERDKLVRDAMKSSNIPLIEVTASKSYDVNNLFKLLSPVLSYAPGTIQVSDTSAIAEHAVAHKSDTTSEKPRQKVQQATKAVVTPDDHSSNNEGNVPVPKLFSRDAIMAMENSVTTDMRVGN